MGRKNLQRLIKLLFLISLLIPIFSEEYSYRVKMDLFSGKSVIKDSIVDDTLFIFIKTSVALGTVKIENVGKIYLKELKPVSIISKYNRVGKKSEGYVKFLQNSIETYLTGENKRFYDSLKFEPNDWLILPFFLKYYDKDLYRCSMIHGDYELKRRYLNDTILWRDKKKSLVIKLYSDKFIYMKAGKILMEINDGK
ncbi:TPA: hypothetical protein DCG82_03440 [candidate division WOR-3]|uniref:Uncharacterized protein n=2 Tax=Bacteria candidate phyla TaxID=1783234 RepID=A0A348MK64_UNCW3|nr:hypothetical protein [candidate division WOR-3 bacterium]HCP17509.1 hypothetical protein [candidate division WOR-3 bacterium]